MGVAQIKKIKKVHLFSNFACGRTLPTHSTGLQPIQLVPKNCFYRNLSIGRSNKKFSKNLVHLFSNFDSGRTSQLVPNPFNWSPTHSTGPQKLFFTDISVSVAQIKKNSKNLVHLFSNFDSGRTSQLAPNPFNWSPTHSTGPQKLSFTEISVSVAQIKKFNKLSPFIFEF